MLSIRSELVQMAKGGASKKIKKGHSVNGTYHEAVYLGLTTSHMVDAGIGHDMMVRMVGDMGTMPEKGDAVTLYWQPGDLRLHTD